MAPCQAVSTPPQSSSGTQAHSASSDGIASQVREVVYNRGGPAFLSFPLASCHTTLQHSRVTVLWLLSAYSRLIQVFCIYGVSLLCFWTLCNNKSSMSLRIPPVSCSKTWVQVLLHEIWHLPYCLFPAPSSAVIVCWVSDNGPSAFCVVIPSRGFDLHS